MKITREGVELINQGAQFLKYGAMLGFLATSVLIINLNNKAFQFVFKDNAKKYFWFFMLISLIPLLIIIYVFTFFFGRLNISKAAFF